MTTRGTREWLPPHVLPLFIKTRVVAAAAATDAQVAAAASPRGKGGIVGPFGERRVGRCVPLGLTAVARGLVPLTNVTSFLRVNLYIQHIHGRETKALL